MNSSSQRSDPVNIFCERSWPKAIAVTGALGSGKTECVLNMAIAFRSCGEYVTIADVISSIRTSVSDRSQKSFVPVVSAY